MGADCPSLPYGACNDCAPTPQIAIRGGCTAEAITEAIALCERKGNMVMAKQAKALLAERVT